MREFTAVDRNRRQGRQLRRAGGSRPKEKEKKKKRKKKRKKRKKEKKELLNNVKLRTYKVLLFPIFQ